MLLLLLVWGDGDDGEEEDPNGPKQKVSKLCTS
jgi:hypothetical protein